MNTTRQRLFDPGLQPERTILAWRRLCLAAFGVSLGGLRVMWWFLGPWAIAPAALLIGGTFVLLLASWRSYRAQVNALTADTAGPTSPGNGRLILATTVLTLVFGTGALVSVAALAVR